MAGDGREEERIGIAESDVLSGRVGDIAREAILMSIGVEERAGHERAFGVAGDIMQDNFVFFLGFEVETAARGGHRSEHTDPGRSIRVVGIPRIADTDAGGARGALRVGVGLVDKGDGGGHRFGGGAGVDGRIESIVDIGERCGVEIVLFGVVFARLVREIGATDTCDDIGGFVARQRDSIADSDEGGGRGTKEDAYHASGRLLRTARDERVELGRDVDSTFWKRSGKRRGKKGAIGVGKILFGRIVSLDHRRAAVVEIFIQFVDVITGRSEERGIGKKGFLYYTCRKVLEIGLIN